MERPEEAALEQEQQHQEAAAEGEEEKGQEQAESGVEGEAPSTTSDETATAAATTTEGESWVYLDDTGAERGPFTLQEMLTWWNCSLLRADLQVKRQSEQQFTDLSARPEFNPQLYYEAYYAHYYYQQQQQQQQQQSQQDYTSTAGAVLAPAAAPAEAPAADADKELAARLMAEEAGYSQLGTFNARTGRFQAKRKGWDDPAGRQIAHYFDEQQWQQQCATPKKVKLSKKAVKHFKEKKKNKKKVPSYLLGD